MGQKPCFFCFVFELRLSQKCFYRKEHKEITKDTKIKESNIQTIVLFVKTLCDPCGKIFLAFKTASTSSTFTTPDSNGKCVQLWLKM